MPVPSNCWIRKRALSSTRGGGWAAAPSLLCSSRLMPGIPLLARGCLGPHCVTRRSPSLSLSVFSCQLLSSRSSCAPYASYKLEHPTHARPRRTRRRKVACLRSLVRGTRAGHNNSSQPNGQPTLTTPHYSDSTYSYYSRRMQVRHLTPPTGASVLHPISAVLFSFFFSYLTLHLVS